MVRVAGHVTGAGQADQVSDHRTRGQVVRRRTLQVPAQQGRGTRGEDHGPGGQVRDLARRLVTHGRHSSE